jgi:hypothetical protein
MVPEDGSGPDEQDAERWLVVNGRRWRRTDPELPEEVAAALRSHLGSAGRRHDETAVAAARRRVGIAKHGLGERGPKWWEEPLSARIERAREALAELDAE